MSSEARKAYQRDYQRIWVAKRRAAYFADKTCAWCGSNEALQLDHIHRAGKVANSIWSWTAERQSAELAKCQILCKICHRAKTNRENSTARHGSNSRYSSGCRCRPCTDAHVRVSNEWRWRTGRRNRRYLPRVA